MSSLLQSLGRPLTARATAMLATLGAARVQEFQQQQREAARSSSFDLMRVLHAIGRGDPLQKVKAVFALQEFMRAWDQSIRRYPGQLREMITKGDFPSGSFLAQYIERFLVIPGEIDEGWRMIFDVHDVAQAEMQVLKGEFKTLDVTAGFQFRKRRPGERVELEPITGAEVSTPYDMYGAAIGIERVWWDDQDYLSISDVITMFRAKYYDNRSSNFYSLITSLSSAIDYNTGADLTAKINGAAATILRAVKDKGYAAGPSSPFYILHQPEQAAAVMAVLATQSDVAVATRTSKEKLAYRMVPINSVYVPATGVSSGPYVILPGRKLRGGLRMDLTLFGDFDIYSYSEALAGYGRYAGLVGDSDQIKRIT